MSGEFIAGVGFLITLATFIGLVYWRWSNMVGAVDKDLQSHKLHVAETYATKRSMNEGLSAVSKSIDDFGERIDKRLDTMTDRLDRVIEASHKPTRRQN